jgi:hypothetical protein
MGRRVVVPAILTLIGSSSECALNEQSFRQLLDWSKCPLWVKKSTLMGGGRRSRSLQCHQSGVS